MYNFQQKWKEDKHYIYIFPAKISKTLQNEWLSNMKFLKIAHWQVIYLYKVYIKQIYALKEDIEFISTWYQVYFIPFSIRAFEN